MTVSLYLLPPGTERERSRLIGEALRSLGGPDYSRALYLTPTEFLAEAGRAHAHAALGPAYIPPTITTLGRYSRILAGKASDRRTLPRALAPLALRHSSPTMGMGFAHIVSHLLHELTEAYPLAGTDRMRETLDALAGELNMPETIRGRIGQALDAAGSYRLGVESAGLADEARLPALAIEAAQGMRGVDLLVLDGFYELTVADELLVHALVGNAAETLALVPVSGPGDDLAHCFAPGVASRFGAEPQMVSPSRTLRASPPYRAAPSVEDEVEEIARRIKAGALAGRWPALEDITVVFPDLDAYRDLVARVFGRYGVPVRIAGGRPLARLRPVGDLLALLRSMRDNCPRREFARVLASPSMTGIPDGVRRAAPSLALDPELIVGREAWARALSAPGLVDAADLIARLAAPPDEDSYGGFVAFVRAISADLGFQPGPDIREALDGVLDLLALLDEIAGRAVDFASFVEAVEGLLEATPEPRDDRDGAGVLVTAMLDARGLDPRILFMGGMKDGAMPARQDLDLLLPEALRVRLGLVDMKRHLSLQERVFGRLCLAAGELFVSYPAQEGDKVFLPTPFLQGGEGREEHVFGLLSQEEVQTRAGSLPWRERLAEIGPLGGIADRGKTLRVTEIDAFRRCPRRYFIERVMRLEPAQARDFELEPRALGTALHKVMERLSARKPGNREEWGEALRAALDETIPALAFDPFLGSVIRETFLAVEDDLYAIEEELREGGFETAMVEHAIEGEPAPGIRLSGKVDRIDARADGAASVIDYKSGGKPLSGTAVRDRGETLQLLLYAAMLGPMGLRPERVGIHLLSDLKVSWLPMKTDARKGVTLDDYVAAAMGYLTETVAALRAGDFTALPLNEQTCRGCHERPFCPYIQGIGGAA
jgi:RecB family exonuclease